MQHIAFALHFMPLIYYLHMHIRSKALSHVEDLKILEIDIMIGKDEKDILLLG
jgi:hypothetical protein